MGDNGGGVGDRLRGYLERIERLREEIKALKDDERSVFAEAKAAGFDTRTMRDVLKWRAMEEAEREEREALFDLYRAALGGLSDTPLGSAALRRFRKPPPGGTDPDSSAGSTHSSDDAEAPEAPRSSVTPQDLLTAKAEGAAAAKAGKPVLANPYTDARRAAWDEGWCAAQGSDGMDIPAAFRRSSPKKAKDRGEDADREGKGPGGDA